MRSPSPESCCRPGRPPPCLSVLPPSACVYDPPPLGSHRCVPMPPVGKLHAWINFRLSPGNTHPWVNPNRKFPHQPEYYDHILGYVQNIAQMIYIVILGSCDVIFSCEYLVRTRFLFRFQLCLRFPTYIPSTRCLEKQSLSINKIALLVLCKNF